MITSSSRGHKTYFDGTNWRYVDNNEIDTDNRPCKRCGRMPTAEGYDACLCHIDGVKSACCGHGLQEPYSVREDDLELQQELPLQMITETFGGLIIN